MLTDHGALVKIGSFQSYAKGVNGEVFVKNETTLVIKNFTYDGSAPDAFFWTGTTSKPNSVGTILPYPFEGKFYHYEDKTAPVLGKFNGENIILTLPDNLKATNIKWLSVWCRQFGLNFGDIFFPDDLNLHG